MSNKKDKSRLDMLLIERGLVNTRSKAQALILAGKVIVNNHRVDKPGHQVSLESLIHIKAPPTSFASRGGEKLQAALDHWKPNISGKICLDIGASTGGFTDVLLKAGAKKVYAVDVGYGQLHWNLRNDPRVVNMERTHFNKIEVGALEEQPEIVTADVSFISLTKILPHLLKHLGKSAEMFLLVKPQFEVGKENVGKGGIVKDEAMRIEAVKKVIEAALKLEMESQGYIKSPITGAEGNVEYLLALTWKKG